MNLKPLCKNYNLHIKLIEPLTYVTFNGITTIFNNNELEELECGLVDLAHAICVYKKQVIKEPAL